MTITLHWWFLPLAFFVLGVYRLGSFIPVGGSAIIGIDGLLWLVIAVALTVGHYI